MNPGEVTFWLSREEARELDQRALQEFGMPSLLLMENAGRGCAELLMRLNSPRRPVLILCGPGNNGGDGFVIARHLDNQGLTCSLWLVGDPAALPPDARLNHDIAGRAGIPCRRLAVDATSPASACLNGQRELADSGWIVDALFGTGLTRPLAFPYDALADAVNHAGRPILAVDIPSGLDSDAGEPLGTAIQATHTATFVAPKKGFLNPHSRRWTGELHVIDIGVPRRLVDDYRRRRNG